MPSITPRTIRVTCDMQIAGERRRLAKARAEHDAVIAALREVDIALDRAELAIRMARRRGNDYAAYQDDFNAALRARWPLAIRARAAHDALAKVLAGHAARVKHAVQTRDMMLRHLAIAA